MRDTIRAALILAALTAIPHFALAQPPASQDGAMAGMAMAPGNAHPSSTAFKAADDRMMRAMNKPLTGDADQDFVAGMLPHHQGAVDMARVELRYGKDPELRRLASGIIRAQRQEIAQMQTWQARHPTR